jgi:hypothetical protein
VEKVLEAQVQIIQSAYASSLSFGPNSLFSGILTIRAWLYQQTDILPVTQEARQ